MSRDYGKIPRGTKANATALPVEIQISIGGQHTLEQLALELQKAVARLQDHDVFGVRKFTARLEPLNEKGQLIALWEGDQPVQRIDVPPLPKEKPYRD